LARAALAPFHDPTLAQRNLARAEKWRRAAQQRFDSNPDALAVRHRIDDAHKTLKKAVASFNREVVAAVESLPDIVPQRSFAPRQPRLNAVEALLPLFTTRDDYLEATRKLLAAKLQYDEPGSEGSK
jgi:hypothetical protein